MKALVAIAATALLWSGCSVDKSGTGDVTGRGGIGGGARGGTGGTAGTTGSAGTGTGGTGGAGATGTAGTSGGAGTTGTAGTSGAAGTSGGAGTTGAAGRGGTGGGAGAGGTTGSAGRGGAGGTSGTSGTGTGGSSGRGGVSGTGGAGTIACLGPSALVIGGEDTGYVRCMGGGGILHRPHAVDCPSLLPRTGGGACTAPGTTAEPCANDAACTAKPHGTCAMVPTNRLPACGCVYGCVRDSDCATGQICECGDPIGVCRAAACATDAACPAGSLCASADLAWGGCANSPPPRGYECQAPADTCLTNINCTTTLPVCAFSPAAGTRACHEAQVLCP